MLVAPPLPGFVRAVKEFQQLGLVNKAIIDATAVDIPVVALAKNQTERKERFLRQALVLLVAFMIAPFHARAVSKWFSKHVGFASKELNQRLMQVSFKDLGSVQKLQQGIEKLYQHQFKEALPAALKHGATESLRQNLVKAKTGFLMTDLAVCGLLLSSIGFIKVMFGKFLSGKDQFSGELGLVEEKTLDELYDKDNQKGWFRLSKNIKGIVTLGLGIGIPVLTGLVLRKVLMKGQLTGASGFLSKKVAPWLDYNYPQYVKFMRGWPLLSDGAQIMLSLLLTLGELTSARSKRELKELAIQRNSIDAVFFFGAPVFMKLLSGSTTVQGAIDKVASKSPVVIQRVAKRAATTYLVSFALTLLAVAGIVTLTNQITRKAVKKEAAKLTETSKKNPVKKEKASSVQQRKGRVKPTLSFEQQPLSVQPRRSRGRANVYYGFYPPYYSQPVSWGYGLQPYSQSWWSPYGIVGYNGYYGLS